MTNTNHQYEYSYKTAQPGHHHGYLTKPLMEIMSEISPPPESNQKLRILDIGCGNGSLSNFLAQQGY